MSRLTQGVECHGPCLSLRLDEPHTHEFDRYTVHAKIVVHLVAQTSGIGLPDATRVLQDSVRTCRKRRQFLLPAYV